MRPARTIHAFAATFALACAPTGPETRDQGPAAASEAKAPADAAKAPADAAKPAAPAETPTPTEVKPTVSDAAPALVAGPDRYQLPALFSECDQEPPLCGAHVVDLAAGTVTAVYTRAGEAPGWFAREGEGEARPVTVEIVATPPWEGRLTRGYGGRPVAEMVITVSPRPEGVPELLELSTVSWISDTLTFRGGKLYGTGVLKSAPTRSGLLEIDPASVAVRTVAVADRQVFDVAPGGEGLILSLTHKKRSTIARFDPASGALSAEVEVTTAKDLRRLCTRPSIYQDGLIAFVQGDRVYTSFGCVMDD